MKKGKAEQGKSTGSPEDEGGTQLQTGKSSGWAAPRR